MALTYGFFNSVNEDRTYNADSLTKWLSTIISNGVFGNVDGDINGLKVVPKSGLTVTVKAGKGFIDGHYIFNDADLDLTLTAADITLNRIDSVVMYLDNNSRVLGIKVLTGTAASTPTAPTLSRTSTLKEYCLAQITVNKLVTSITSAEIRDTRPYKTDGQVSTNPPDLCGWCETIAPLPENFNTNVFSQWETIFYNWFDALQTEVATKTMFKEYTSRYVVSSVPVSDIPINISQYSNSLDILNVYVNGMKINPDDDYTVASNKASITLTYPIDVAGTEVYFQVFKSVYDDSVESVMTSLTAAQNEIAKLEKVIYFATGTDDNKALSTIAQNYLAGTGAFSGVDTNGQMRVEVRGTLGVTDYYSGNGTEALPYTYFAFGRASNSSRKIIFDFSNADRITINAAGSYATIFSGDDVFVENVRVNVASGNYVKFFSGERVDVRDSEFYGTATNDIICLNCCGNFDNNKVSIASTSGNAFCSYGNGNLTRVNGGTYYAWTAGSGKESVCFYVEASKTENVLVLDKVNCPLYSRSGYSQTNTIKVNSGYACLTGNTVHKAASLYSTTKCTNVGEMVISKNIP